MMTRYINYPFGAFVSILRLHTVSGKGNASTEDAQILMRANRRRKAEDESQSSVPPVARNSKFAFAAD